MNPNLEAALLVLLILCALLFTSWRDEVAEKADIKSYCAAVAAHAVDPRVGWVDSRKVCRP